MEWNVRETVQSARSVFRLAIWRMISVYKQYHLRLLCSLSEAEVNIQLSHLFSHQSPNLNGEFPMETLFGLFAILFVWANWDLWWFSWYLNVWVYSFRLSLVRGIAVLKKLVVVQINRVPQNPSCPFCFSLTELGLVPGLNIQEFTFTSDSLANQIYSKWVSQSMWDNIYFVI